MATTALVISDRQQANALRKVKLSWDTGTGLAWGHRVILADGVNAQAYADGRIPIEDARQKLIERERAWSIAANGGNPDNETWHLNTLAEIRKYTYRRIMNAMRDPGGEPDRAQIAGNLSTPAGYINVHSAASISGFIDDPAWNTPTTNSARGDISAVGVNIGQLDHGEAELDLDF